MKLSDYKNEDALDLLADILDPISEIFADKEMARIFRGGGTKIQAVKYALKNYKKNIVTILARMEGVSVDEYNGTVITMTKQLLEMLNDKELVGFFSSQDEKNAEKSSGPAMGSTEEKSK